jgi:hypothetical protein
MSDGRHGRTRVALRRPAAPQRPPATARAPVVERAIREPGEPIDVRTRVEMEQRLGHDFRDVRVVRGPTADAAARLLAAEAFTSGRRIVFAAGRYAPATSAGRRLLAHELAHSIQQGPSGTEPLAFRSPRDTIEASHPLEREADTAADRVAAGLAVAPGAITPAAPAAVGRIARQPASPPLEVPDSPGAVGTIADEIERLLTWDPDDAFERVRRRLARLAPITRRALLADLTPRVSAPGQATLARLAAELTPPTEPGEGTAEAAERSEPEGADVATDEARAGEAADGAAPAEPAAEPGLLPDEPAEAPEPEPEEAPAEDPGPEAVPVPELEGEAREAAPEAGAAPTEEPAEVETAPATAPPTPAEAAGPPEAAVDYAPVDELDAEATEIVDEADEDLGIEERVSPPGADLAMSVPAVETESFPEGPEPGETDMPGGGPPAAEEDADEPDGGDTEVEVAAVGPQAPDAPQELGAATVDEDEAEPGGAETTGDLEAADVEPEPEAGEPPLDAAGDEEAVAAEDDDTGAMPADGGGVPIEEPPEPVAPDVSGQDPAAAMATVASLPPDQALAATGGAKVAAAQSVATQREQLAAAPPTLERPSGAPSAAEQAAEAAEASAAAGAPARLQRVPEPPATSPAPLAAAVRHLRRAGRAVRGRSRGAPAVDPHAARARSGARGDRGGPAARDARRRRRPAARPRAARPARRGRPAGRPGGHPRCRAADGGGAPVPGRAARDADGDDRRARRASGRRPRRSRP